MSSFLRLFLLSFPFSFLCFSLPSLMLSGGDVRPLALVVIGRGQITTPYILVIPSEGDYCFLGRLFSFLSSIPPSPNDHKHKQSRSLSCPPSPWVLMCPFCSVLVLFSWPSCLHVCSALNVAGYFTLSAFDFFFFSLHSCALIFSIEPLLNHLPPPLLLSKQYNYRQLMELRLSNKQSHSSTNVCYLSSWTFSLAECCCYLSLLSLL